MHTTYTYIALQMYISVCVCAAHIVLGKAKANKANGNSDAPTIRMQFRLESIEARTNTHTHSIVCASLCVYVMANECYSYLQMDSRGASYMQGIPHISLDKPRHLSPQFSAFN